MPELAGAENVVDGGELVAKLASYVPDVIVRRLAGDPAILTNPLAERFTGAVLVADVSGFTRMSELLAKRGAIGAETLNRLLNDYFGRAIAVITAHGGDVVRFAGDALLAAWYPESDGGIAELTSRAARCALEVQNELRDYQSGEGLPLSLKLGVGTGEFVFLHVGGIRDRWEFLVFGPAFVQAFMALDKAAPGQVVLSLRAWAHVSSEFAGRQLAMGSVLVESALASVQSRSPPRLSLSDEMASPLRSYIPGTVSSCLSAGQDDWLGELRVATVLFVNLPDLNYATPLDRAQQIVQYLQRELYRFEGHINKLNVDDKGTSLLAAMGLPPLVHEDDAKRAVQAALAMQHKLADLGLRTSMGIATGRVFCGLIGSQRRREYTLLGDAVNVSARLMQAALGDVLCDEATFHMAHSRIDFERLADIAIMGRTESVAVYRPLESKRPLPAAGGAVVGRPREREILARQIRALVAGTETATVILEGDAGIGKSRLVSDAVDMARACGVSCFAGAGDSVEASTLYYAWRPVFRQVLGLDSVDRAPDARRRHILTQLAPRPDLLRLAPLLESILPCGFEDNEVTANMRGQVRGENTRTLLLELLAGAVARSPTLIVLDDAHWQDSASWAVTSLVSRRMASVLLLVATRPFSQNSPAEYNQLLRDAHTTHVQLQRLTPADTAVLVAQCIGVASVPEKIVSLVQEMAEGNPLFIEELVYALRDGGLLQIEGGQCRLTADFPDGTRLGCPDTLHGVIACRIDRLGTAQQLAIKVASVIGRHFRFGVLHDNYPLEGEKSKLGEHLALAQQADIVNLETPGPEAAYLFRHAIIQQVAYGLLPFQQREQLHRAIAKWYEDRCDANLPQRHSFLAHHWRYGGQPAKAVDYMEKAGDAALRSGAYSEAAGFFADALSLDLGARLATSASRRARWERLLGEACLGLGRLSESREHLQHAIGLFGRPAPDTPAKLAVHFLRQAFGQLRQRALRLAGLRRLPQRRTAVADTDVEVARAYERLVEIYYLCGEKFRLLHAMVVTLNLTEKAGPSAELARAYASNSFAAGLLGWQRLSRAYSRDAVAIAQLIDDPVATAWVRGALGISVLGRGDAAQATDTLRQAIDVYARLGDWQHWGECMAMMAQAAYVVGDFRRGIEVWTEFYSTARSRGDQLQQAWGLNGQAEGLLRTGDAPQIDQAILLLHAAMALFTENIDKISLVTSYGLLASANLRRGDREAARRAADDGMELLETLPSPTSYYLLGGYVGVTETYLALSDGAERQDRRLLASRVRQACRALGRYARTLPLGGPAACRCKGQALWLNGKRNRALRAWEKSLRLAARLQMPYDEALAHLELGQHLPAGHRQREAHLTRACDRFASIGAQFDLDRARKLGSPSTKMQ